MTPKLGSRSSVTLSNENTDIKVQSADGTVFDLHRALLAAYAGAFPGPEIGTDNETVVLTEPSNVLRICFDFMYPKRHPDLEDIKDFELLAAVAEAVGKYEIFSAINTCNTRLRAFIPAHAEEILVYALKHDYPSLSIETANYLARAPFTSVLKQLPPPFMVPWSLYRDAWTAVFKDAVNHILKLSPSSMAHCHADTSFSADTSICATCRSLLHAQLAAWEDIRVVDSLKKTLEAARDPGIRLPGCCAAIPRGGYSGAAKPDFKCTHVIKLAELCQKRMLAIPPFQSFIPGRET